MKKEKRKKKKKKNYFLETRKVDVHKSERIQQSIPRFRFKFRNGLFQFEGRNFVEAFEIVKKRNRLLPFISFYFPEGKYNSLNVTPRIVLKFEST